MSQLGFFKRGQRYLQEMSFQAQDFANFYFKGLTIVAGIISFLVAMFFGKFRYCVYTMCVVYVFNMIAFVPAWPFWHDKKGQWTGNRSTSKDEEQKLKEQEKSTKKKKK